MQIRLLSFVRCPVLSYVRHVLKTVVIFTHDFKSVRRPVGCRVCVGFVPPPPCSVACNGWTFIFFLLYREKWQQLDCSSIAAKERRCSVHRLLSLDVSVINFYESTSAAWKRCRFDRERRASDASQWNDSNIRWHDETFQTDADSPSGRLVNHIFSNLNPFDKKI